MAPAHAEDRPPIRLELAACVEHLRHEIELAVRVEVGDDAARDARTVVRVDCATGGADAGVVLEVRPPDSARRYRYALDWSAQPQDARPRLIALAVVEAIDASRIELTAVAEPPVVVHAVAPPPPIVVAPSVWSFAIAVDRRAFAARAGVSLLGIGVGAARRVTPHLWLAGDVAGEGATVVSGSGAETVRSLSIAPRLAYRVGGRVYGELGIGARLGVVRIAGEPLARSGLVGQRLVRVWAGPAASVAIGGALTRGIALTAELEVGHAVTGATARDLGEPVATLDGGWSAFGVAVTIAL